LYDEMARGLMPALTRNSARTLLTLVWPLLRSSPAIKAPFSSARRIAPGTNVFCGAPLMKGAFSRMAATAKSVEGETSSCDEAIEARRASAESLTPGRIAE
jgi:hypothetical protein